MLAKNVLEMQIEHSSKQLEDLGNSHVPDDDPCARYEYHVKELDLRYDIAERRAAVEALSSGEGLNLHGKHRVPNEKWAETPFRLEIRWGGRDDPEAGAFVLITEPGPELEALSRAREANYLDLAHAYVQRFNARPLAERRRAFDLGNAMSGMHPAAVARIGRRGDELYVE